MGQQPERDQSAGGVGWLSKVPWILAAAALALLLSIVAWLLHDRMPAKSVVEVSLQASRWQRALGGGPWRNLPFQISAREEELVNRCAKLSRRYRSTHNKKRRLFDDEVRTQLESILHEKPELFYAEFLLGQWHRHAGDDELADRWLARAFAHAPVTLTQGYQFSDGRPLVGARVDSYEIECLRVRNRSLAPSLRLDFPGLTTDNDGCIRLPVYDTVYRRYSMSSPAGHVTKYPRLGYFKVGWTGELPIARIWRPGEDPGGNPAYEDAIASQDLRLAGDGWRFGVEWVARNRRDGTVVLADGRGHSRVPQELPQRSPLIEHASWLDMACCQLDVEPGQLEVIRLKVFEHARRLPLRDTEYRAGFVALGRDRLCLWSIDRPLPNSLDLWLETFVCQSGTVTHRLEPQAGASVRIGPGSVSISEIQAGQMDYAGRFVPPARDVHQTLSVSLVTKRLPPGKQHIIVAVDKQGRRRPLDPLLSAMTGVAVEYVDLPLDSLSHFELKEFRSREKVYFDGVQLPPADAEPAGPAPVLEVVVDEKPVSWSAEDRVPGLLRLTLSPGTPRAHSRAIGPTKTGNRPDSEEAGSFTLSLAQSPCLLGPSPQRSMILLDRRGERLEWRSSQSSTSISVNGQRSDRLVYRFSLNELGAIRITLRQ